MRGRAAGGGSISRACLRKRREQREIQRGEGDVLLKREKTRAKRKRRRHRKAEHRILKETNNEKVDQRHSALSFPSYEARARVTHR